MGYNEYVKDVRAGGQTPKDPYTHAKYILDSEAELVSDFHKLIDGQMRLANISDPKQLALEQMQIYNVIDLFNMSLKEANLTPLFRYCYYCWKGGLSLTRAKKGRERGFQAMVGATQAPAESEGFVQGGMGLQDEEQESQIFKRLAGIKPKVKKTDEW